ncbi:hypothetical protein NDN08_007534 [Rhodosorus marinus]|uniref:ATP-dependent (S)-NAD(P)H-hydrate dehydratase n=1 Tax=Rhodosorus marinus TaxID=101924 RepID=A0AAV8V2M3_9RHOD|nr:hypothetical protein NDN08_007534 [Rhodosorus marinus]
MFRNSVRLSSFLAPPSVITGRTRLRMGDDARKSIAAAARLMNQYAGSQAKVFSECIPRFSDSNHKGQHGRIGVVGGSLEYTGAPYYAATAALRSGAELAYLICHPDAAIPIKTYSPELIVLPFLNMEGLPSALATLKRCHAIAIGPGLGRSSEARQFISEVMKMASNENIPVVLDADALWFLALRDDGPGLIHEATSPVIITPNVVEYNRLIPANSDQSVEATRTLYGENVVVLLKGPTDVVASKGGLINVHMPALGSPRRCGGQGDVLSGLTTLYAAWVMMSNASWDQAYIAPYFASAVTRCAAAISFEAHGRAMLTTDILDTVGQVFESAFPSSEFTEKH